MRIVQIIEGTVEKISGGSVLVKGLTGEADWYPLCLVERGREIPCPACLFPDLTNVHAPEAHPEYPRDPIPRRERATPVPATEHEVQEALAVVNDHLGFGGAFTHTGTELKGRTPDGEGDFSKTYFSSGDCEELANAFHVLSVRLAKKEG